MKIRNYYIICLVIILAMAYVPVAFGSVSAEEAARLGTTLTRIGAEKAGNKEGTIPEYTGGLTTTPAGYKPGTGVFPDPYPNEKPLFSIDARNMDQYAEKLTEGTKGLMKLYPGFRVDVYQTHRSVAFPDWVLDNVAKNAVTAKTENGGLTLVNAHGGAPFPIPKDGYEAMWNHLTRFVGKSIESHNWTGFVDPNGKLIHASTYILAQDYPYYLEDQNRDDSIYYVKMFVRFIGPARMNGQNYLFLDPLDAYGIGRTVYQYMPGQRRVKLAPEITFDGLQPASAGTATVDDSYGFNGSMERYDFKLIGKKEIYTPYNCYKLNHNVEPKKLWTPNYMNPDMVRWELHRVWVVDATLKEGKRHIYAKRRFYLDEDSWCIAAGENYDAHGNLFKANFTYQRPNYELPSPYSEFAVFYNLISRLYSSDNWTGHPDGYYRQTDIRPESFFTPARLSGVGIR